VQARAAAWVLEKMGVITPRTAFVRVYINQRYVGLYVAAEQLSVGCGFAVQLVGCVVC
jgi:hypothetical protein